MNAKPEHRIRVGGRPEPGFEGDTGTCDTCHAPVVGRIIHIKNPKPGNRRSWGPFWQHSAAKAVRS